MADTYAVVDASGTVVNLVAWDGTTTWSPPSGTTAVKVTSSTGTAYIDGTYADGVFTAPASSDS